MSFRSRATTAAAALAVCVATLTVTGIGGGSLPAHAAVPAAASASAGTAPKIHWTSCQDGSQAQCALLTVPLDHSKPNGPTVQVGVTRVLHTTRRYRGVIFTNAGGPGADGGFLASYGAYVPRRIGLSYDWYGFTPRGVGASRPTLSCDKTVFGFDRPDYRPTTPKLRHYWSAKTADYAKACRTGQGHELLDHLRTTDEVGDYETLRKAIGAQKVTFLGYSYGTYVAEVYAMRHPSSLAGIVLDGVIDPTRVFYKSNLDQDRAFQVGIEKFFAWMAEHDDVYHAGNTAKSVSAAYDRLEKQLATHPAGGRLTSSDLTDAVLPAAYYNLTWLTEGRALADLVHGRPAAMIRAYRSNGSPGDDQGYAAYLGTECTDAPWPHRLKTYLADNRRVDRSAPFETWSNGWYNAPCRAWPAKGGPRVKVTGSKYHGPVLLFNEQYDGPTPYSGALEMRGIFKQARLVEGVGGSSHAVSFYSSCPLARIASFLKNGALPPRVAGDRADVKCPGLRPPSPGSDRPVAATKVPPMPAMTSLFRS